MEVKEIIEIVEKKTEMLHHTQGIRSRNNQ